MPIFRRRPPSIDYEELAKAMLPAIAQAATVSSGATYPMANPSSPFAQTAGGMLENPLPRPLADFDSQFGPGLPFWPDPLDPLGPNGRVAPRRSQYLVAWNLQITDRQVPWTMLRWLAEDCDVVNRCIQLTQDEQCGLDWGWSYSPQLLQQIMQDTGETNSAKATALAREKYGAELLKVQSFFESPDPDMNQTFADWLQALLWDHLVYDGVAVYPRRNLDGSLRNLELVDASTIKLLRDNRGRIPAAPAPAYQQILYGFPRGEFQHTTDEADDQFLDDQLAYFIRRPRNTSVYGYPQVEEVMALATTYLGRQAWMRAEYTTGVTPKMIVNVKDDDKWTPEQWGIYEQAFNDRLAGQIARRQQAFFLKWGAEAAWAPQIDEHYKADYDNWLISQIGSRFGRPASMLGVQAKAGLSGGKQMEGEMNQSDVYSGKALTGWLIGVLNTLARRYLGVGPEITAVCTGGGSEEDMLQTAQADASDVGAGIQTRNQVRAKRGDPLMDEPEADQLSITTAAGVTFLSGLLAAQEQGAPPGGGPVVPGGPPTSPVPPAAAGAAVPPGTNQPALPPAAKAVKGDGFPKALGDRKAVEAKIVAYYQPKLAAAMKGLYPGIVAAARKMASTATKAADEKAVAAFRTAHPPQTAKLEATIAALWADSWMAGTTGAAAAGVDADDVAPDVDGWEPGWGETADPDDMPDPMSTFLAGASATAGLLAGGQMDRIANAIAAASSGGQAASDVTDAIGNDDYAGTVAGNETANGAEGGAQAAYQSADVQWDWVLDGGACQLCQDSADGSPYDADADMPPAHSNCGCGSHPVANDDEE